MTTSQRVLILVAAAAGGAAMLAGEPIPSASLLAGVVYGLGRLAWALVAALPRRRDPSPWEEKR